MPKSRPNTRSAEGLAKALSAKGRIDEYVEALSDEKLMERLLSEEGLS